MLVKILGGALLVAGLALSVIFTLYINKVEAYGKLEVQYKEQRKQTKKAIEQMQEMTLQNERNIARASQLQEERTKDGIQYQKAINKLRQSQESSKKAALKYPERFGRIATFNLHRSMRDVCRTGGGTRQDCAIKIPTAPKARSTTPSKRDTQDNDGVAKTGRSR